MSRQWNEQAKEFASEGLSKQENWASDGGRKQSSERAKEWVSKNWASIGAKNWRSERAKEWRSDGVSKQRSEQAKEWASDGVSCLCEKKISKEWITRDKLTICYLGSQWSHRTELWISGAWVTAHDVKAVFSRLWEFFFLSLSFCFILFFLFLFVLFCSFFIFTRRTQ